MDLLNFSGCDKCAEWFHGDCINLGKSEAKKVEEWYCRDCLGNKSKFIMPTSILLC